MQPDTPPEPFNSFMLPVTDGHTLYVEERGNPAGLPLVSFHGGPGSHSKPKHRARYDLAKFRLIMFDQRCGGQSTPKAVDERKALAGFSPQAIVADAEAIRRHLQLDSWHVTGASWGSAMALLYAITHPQATLSLTLRAIFLAQASDWAWMAEGARLFAPPAYAAALARFPDAPPDQLLNAMADRILSAPRFEALAATEVLLALESGLEVLTPPPATDAKESKDDNALLNTGLLYAQSSKYPLPEGWGVTAIAQAALQDKPFAIIHGGADIGCPVKGAYDLKAAHSHADLFIAPNCGHGVDLGGMNDGLYRAALASLR